MIKMVVVKNHKQYRKGQTLLMSWGPAALAAMQGWAQPYRKYQTRVEHPLETR